MAEFFDKLKEAVNTPQARLYGIVLAIFVGTTILSLLMSGAPLGAQIPIVGMLVIFSGLFILLGMYQVACLTKGKCDIFAWIVVGITTVGVLFSSAMTLFRIMHIGKAMRK